jgi:hydroxymethylbilane synthase
VSQASDLVRIGTRGSQLALFQANAVAALLDERAGVDTEIVVIRTTGDRLAEARLDEIGGKRLFVKEIEDALLAGDVDVAVHSSKDMPAVLPPGLDVAAVLPREDPRDAMVLPAARQLPASECTIEDLARELGPEPRIGTSSVRRVAQLIAALPGARFLPIRGNLDTRLRKLDSGDFDAIVLASAGLRRLQQTARISAALPADVCVPAPGQGIIAIEIRSADARARQLVQRIDDPVSAIALVAERAVVRRLGGGCQMPIGAHARLSGTEMTVTGIVISVDGRRSARAVVTGHIADADGLGIRTADQLLEQGADEILAEIQREQAGVEGLQP